MRFGTLTALLWDTVALRIGGFQGTGRKFPFDRSFDALFSLFPRVILAGASRRPGDNSAFLPFSLASRCPRRCSSFHLLCRLAFDCHRRSDLRSSSPALSWLS